MKSLHLTFLYLVGVCLKKSDLASLGGRFDDSNDSFLSVQDSQLSADTENVYDTEMKENWDMHERSVGPAVNNGFALFAPEAYKVLMPNMTFNSSAQRNTVWHIFKNRLWFSWRLPVMICFSLFFIFAMIVLLMLLCYRFEEKHKNFKAVEEPKQQVLYQPVIKPAIKDPDPVQPENKNKVIVEKDFELTLSPIRSPKSTRTRGLLERRGSNASLTLDLSNCPVNGSSYVSPRSCSTKEILMSAGNRMNRKQLRNCLKNVKALHSEFWEIPMNHTERTEIPGSGTKNRYKTILPNEHSRVKLPEVDNDLLSTYINANYIRGYDFEEKTFIATQGPLAHTITDFWRMVWEEKAPAIVMITKLKEKNKVKCEAYLPDYKGCFEDIDVLVMRILPRDGYTIRELFLKKDKETHKVFHFWYTAWPDHKTPSTAKQLLSMALEIESMRQNNRGIMKGPIIVHCSAGIGRTGCFIAIAIGIRQLLEENMVDVLGIVCALRRDRGGMVQTAEQYEFVHQALILFEQTLPNIPGD